MRYPKAHTLTSLVVASLLLPQPTFARDVEVCANLYRRLNSTPQVIGTSSSVRRYAQDLSALNADIRQLRIDMRRQGCGSGSIVTLGSDVDGDECRYMQDTLQRLEDERSGLTEQRNSTRSLLQPSEERVAILSAIRANNCTPSDLYIQTDLDEKERMRIRGLALPKPDEPNPDDPNSSITHLGSTSPAPAPTKEEPIQFPPDRPYDPGKRVRAVGPQFFPQEDIDLANPKSNGQQPLQQ
ncbi:hypothetical protein [Aliirhizobium smilacinae]|uniref:DUF1311 domain-containing protein n=1 Tax=Aliirhizobium smilacinae TaxID=1395944 RepID=A0A5C4XMS6_9HYPH|nr:hypothetical protein [Rhizobium smilacinae]TNM64815.1 hypothetical protein FHP24_00455 [Rhizobium smilacinae]